MYLHSCQSMKLPDTIFCILLRNFEQICTMISNSLNTGLIREFPSISFHNMKLTIHWCIYYIAPSRNFKKVTVSEV
jgi:hypothetical protein